MGMPFDEQRMLDRARTPGGLEHLGTVTHFDEQGLVLAETDAQPLDRGDGVLAVLVKHPRWVDRDI